MTRVFATETADYQAVWEILQPLILVDSVQLDPALSSSYAKHLLEGKTLPISYHNFFSFQATLTDTNAFSLPIQRGFSRLSAKYVTLHKNGTSFVTDFSSPYPTAGFPDRTNDTFRFSLQLGEDLNPCIKPIVWANCTTDSECVSQYIRDPTRCPLNSTTTTEKSSLLDSLSRKCYKTKQRTPECRLSEDNFASFTSKIYKACAQRMLRSTWSVITTVFSMLQREAASWRTKIDRNIKNGITRHKSHEHRRGLGQRLEPGAARDPRPARDLCGRQRCGRTGNGVCSECRRG